MVIRLVATEKIPRNGRHRVRPRFRPPV